MAESSNLQQSPAQDETVALPTSLLPADTSEISGNPLESSPWTTAGSSNNGPSRQQQASSPLSESTKSVLFSSNSIANCANNSPNHIQPPSRRKRSQLSKRQKEDSCPSQQLLQIEPGTDHKALPPSGSDERKGPWPAFEDGGEDIEKRILLLMLTQGVDGVPDSNACWQDTYMQIPVCAPLLGSQQSPAQVVEPCRLCKRYFYFPAIILGVQELQFSTCSARYLR